MATEIELKLYCFPDDIPQVVMHPLISDGIEVSPAKFLENTYYDTPDLALFQERIALRIRKTPTEHLQTIKCAAESVAGLASRPEWETPYSEAFDFSGIGDAKVQSFLQGLHSHLVPVFATSFERRTWRIEVSKKVALWVMVDSGYIASGDRVLPISEVELELIKGSPIDLLDFAATLATDLPLLPDDVSKAERGYQLFLQQSASPRKAAPSPLCAKQNSAKAFHLLASQGIQMWQANLLGTVASHDQEFVHQFRISLRRLGSLLKVFEPALPNRYQARWSKRFKALSRITGNVRDLDVMKSDILKPMQKSGDPEAISHAKQALAALRKVKKESLKQVKELRYGEPILSFSRDLQDLDISDFPKNLSRFAEKQLSDLHQTAVKRLAKTLKRPSPEAAHRFRIALKHLRYSCEFFAPLFDKGEMREYANEICGLQDTFGFINDFHVSLRRLQEWVEQGRISREVREAVGEWHRSHAQDLLLDALQLAQSVMNRCRPWCSECERRESGLMHCRFRRRDFRISIK